MFLYSKRREIHAAKINDPNRHRKRRWIMRTTRNIVLGINVALVVFMLIVGYSDFADPIHFPIWSSMGLGFPVVAAMNILFMLFWLVVQRRFALVSATGLILSFLPLYTYMPLNIPHTTPDNTLKVLSYNVNRFGGWEVRDIVVSPILNYIRDAKADIVCLQESSTTDIGQWRVDKALNHTYIYHDTICVMPSLDCASLYSRYPIVGKERIPIESEYDICGAFRVKIGNDTVHVLSIHLETTSLSPDDKKNFSMLVHGQLNADSTLHTSLRVTDKLVRSLRLRAKQADIVASYIRKHKGEPIILCGDFNDNPISYVRRTIAHELNDCYLASGNGPGISFHVNNIFVRIDNIMCSDHFTPHGCYVDQSIGNSDHYPIICQLSHTCSTK